MPIRSGSPFPLPANATTVVANVTALEPLRMSITLGYDALPELTPEVSASLRRSAELARSLGVHVEPPSRD